MREKIEDVVVMENHMENVREMLIKLSKCNIFMSINKNGHLLIKSDKILNFIQTICLDEKDDFIDCIEYFFGKIKNYSKSLISNDKSKFIIINYDNEASIRFKLAYKCDHSNGELF